MPYYGDALPYYYGGPFSNHSSLMTGTGRTLHSPLGSTRYAPHLTTISESPLSALRRYSPAATMSSRPKRVINTADIDVSKPRPLSNTSNNNNQHNRLRRDRPTIRIRSQALKDNPALREHYERHEKTVGELLVEKFLIKDKKPEGEAELRTKLYSQVSLESDLAKKEREELQEAIKRRITRRMTRRRSSADVHMDPEQLEREVLFAQAQADVLDTLVAEEQAEIEVETRMGTLIKKNLVRSVAPLPRLKHDIEGLSGDEDDDTRTKKLAKKVKKRKKTTDKPSPPGGSQLDSEYDTTRTKKLTKEMNKETNDKLSMTDDDVKINGKSDKTQSDGKEEEEEENDENGEESTGKGLKFKIEASNSVGDFSTLWINAGVAEEQEKQRKKSQGIVEQFRDSVRLPAPKNSIDKIFKGNKKDTIIEEHQEIVVLPVKKRYVKDAARNSVYLTLKTQKNTNINKMAGSDATVARIEAMDDKIDQSSSLSTMIIEKPTNAEESMKIDSITNKTTGITGQPKVNKVAKFRSKDITESDVEVKSISELPPGVEATRGRIGTKDAGLQKLSGVNDDADKVITNESISGPLNRDANVDSTSAITKDPTNDQISAKVLPVSNDQTRVPEIVKSHNSDNNTSSSENLKSVTSADQRSPGKDEIARTIDAEEKIGKPLKRIKKETKDLRKNNGDTIGDESKRLKRSVTSSLDSLDAKAEVKILEDKKSNEKESPPVKGRDLSAAKISSSVTPCSTVAESLPNASTINFPDVEKRLNRAAKNENEEPNVTEIPNDKTRIDENLIAAADLQLSQKIVQKNVEQQSEISKPIGVINKNSEVGGSDISRKNKDNNYQKIVEESSNQQIFDSTNKTAIIKDSKKNDDKNVVEIPKLRKNRVSPLSSRTDATENVESLPISPDLEVVIDKPEANRTKRNKTLITAESNGDVSPLKSKESPKVLAKDKLGKATERKIIEEPLEKKNESSKSILESTKLTNAEVKKKPKTILTIQESPKPEVDSKWVKKIESPTVQKEEEIDFWGEIESQRVEKPSVKLEEKIIATKENTNKDIPSSNDTSDSMVIVLEPEAKSNTLVEIGTRDVTKPLVDAEQKSNKVKKKKKTVESSGCKKKDQEKASAETIFEHFTSSDLVNEKSQQKPESLEDRKENLIEKILSRESSEEQICDSPEIDRFERNLSTIVEENLSPITEEIPNKREALDLVISSLTKEEVSATTKLDTTREPLPESGKDSDLISEAVKEDSLPGVERNVGEPEVSRVSKDEITSTVVNHSEKESVDVSFSNSETSIPTIHIEQVPVTPAEEDIIPVFVPEEEPIEEEADETPGTPTNETINEPSKNISKWHGLADLSLDEPDKDIGPEVYLEQLKKENAKKKVGSSKKKSKKGSVGSTKSSGSSADSSKKKKLGKRKKSSTKTAKDGEKKNDDRSESKVSNSSDTTLKPAGINLRNSPINSGRNSPKQRPLDLVKMFYTTPASLLTATPRDLSKVRRAKIKKRKHSSRTASASSDSTGSTRSTGTTESTGSTEHEDDIEQKRISSTRSNDSGFDGSPRLSNCDMACHKKCEKLTGNLCGLNQKLVAEALQSLKRAPSQSSDNQRNSDGSDHQTSGRITPPATNLPRFKKYTVMDFNFLKVLGKGSFGKVLLAELRRTDCVYAVKCLKKDVVLEDDDVECTLIERKVLTLATRHPYLCHLFCTFQTDSHLFFVMEYLNGGDLMFHIQKSGRFAESRARFYAAEIWSGLNFLHKKGIVYRDLKLDNVLLDFEGHIRIADFGMCKLQIFLDRTADTFCGTPDYMAPEIIKGLKYNQAVDWWSFGVLLYEMLTGQSPFSGCDEDDLFWSICNERPFIPRYLSQEAMDVLICLLEKDAGKRPPAHEISAHPFFHSLQWDRLERRQLEPPFKPALEHTLDTRYFDTAFTAERPRLTPVPEQILTSMDQGVFRGFSYTNPNATD